MNKIYCEFTAYYPSDDLIEGGYYDALGELLNPDIPTVASPKEIPFNTKIKITGTNTEYDNVIYTVRDRGSSIIIDSDGIYHIDILTHNREEANNFGRRRGYIEIIEDKLIEDKRGYNCKVKVVNCDSLNVRDGRPVDGKLGNIKFTLKKGDVVTLGYVYDNWGSIFIDGKNGYVNVKYLKMI